MIVRTLRLSDGRLLDLVASLLDVDPSGRAQLTFPFGGGESVSSVDEISNYKYDRDGYTIESMTFNFGGNSQNSVVFARGTLETGAWSSYQDRNVAQFIVRRQSSSFYDEIGLLVSHTGAPVTKPLTIDEMVSVTTVVNTYAAPLQDGSDEDTTKLAKVVSIQLSELRKLNTQMTEELAKARRVADEDLTERRAKLDKEFDKRNSVLAGETRKLEKQREELKGKEPQYERRLLRETLTNRLHTQASEQSLTSFSRNNGVYLIYILFSIILIVGSLYLTYAYGTQTMTSQVFYVFSFKSIALSAAGLAFAWAGLSGLKTSSIVLRKYERNVRRYGFDMDRASWIVETMLQMNSIEKAEMPAEWLKGVCHDLFRESDGAQDDPKSLEAFAALFDATSRAKIGTNGVEFEIDRKGARKMASND